MNSTKWKYSNFILKIHFSELSKLQGGVAFQCNSKFHFPFGLGTERPRTHPPFTSSKTKRWRFFSPFPSPLSPLLLPTWHMATTYFSSYSFFLLLHHEISSRFTRNSFFIKGKSSTKYPSAIFLLRGNLIIQQLNNWEKDKEKIIVWWREKMGGFIEKDAKGRSWVSCPGNFLRGKAKVREAFSSKNTFKRS